MISKRITRANFDTAATARVVAQVAHRVNPGDWGRLLAEACHRIARLETIIGEGASKAEEALNVLTRR